MAVPMKEFMKPSAICVQFINLSRHFLSNAKVYFLLAFLLALTNHCSGNDDFQRDEFLKREYSLTKPYQGGGTSMVDILPPVLMPNPASCAVIGPVLQSHTQFFNQLESLNTSSQSQGNRRITGLGSSSSSHWDLLGNAMITPEHVRLTPDLQSRQGAVWSRLPFYIRDWELQVHFKIHGQGKKNLNGDGVALWLTKERMQIGPVFGNVNYFTGLGIFIDTYPNHENQHERQFPFISAMVGNGSVAYDHDQDGRDADLGGCQAAVRNVEYDTFILVRYIKNTLTVMADTEGKQEWKECVELPGVHLPQGYYFGASSLTGDLSDNHDLISLKLFELTVERTPEELENEREVTIPSVDYRETPVVMVSEGMSTLTLLFLFIFSVVGLVVFIVAFLFIYTRWKERSRKRFY